MDKLPIKDPPTKVRGILVSLGPGMIVAGSIVGSGELIATTKVGAEAGFWLLWLIIIGCVVKVFTQIEIGRYTISQGETPLKALDSIPGPRFKVNWIVWYWVILTFLILSQQGGIVGGVGQALTVNKTLTNDAVIYNGLQKEIIDLRVARANESDLEVNPLTRMQQQRRLADLEEKIANLPEPKDSYIWATIIAAITSGILWIGRYRFIQAASVLLVASFTVITIINLILLQSTEWAVKGPELLQGLSFRLPPAETSVDGNALATALAAFGIIGMGAAELMMYPYWCIEKGYAKFTGRRDDSAGWLARAKGWVRVLYTDAWVSMVVYTFATIAFYLLGAAVLGRSGLNPAGKDMIRFLGQMYVPVYGEWAGEVFLFGAFAVLYSTFFVAAASMARIVADNLILFRIIPEDDAARARWTRIISALWPLVAVALYWSIGWLRQGQSPALMVLASGLVQALMLPMLSGAALYFCYKRTDERLQPGSIWGIMLLLSFVGFCIIAGWTIIVSFRQGCMT